MSVNLTSTHSTLYHTPGMLRFATSVLCSLCAGSCANGGGAPYYFNPAADPVDDDENLLWFHDYEVPPNGTVRGNGANDGYVSTKSSGGIHSVMLVNTETLGG